MNNLEYQPNDPEIFQRLAINLRRLTDGFGVPFAVDGERHDYPVNPNNLRALGERLHPAALEFDELAIAGRAMYAHASMDNGARRDVIAYTFNRAHQDRYRRLGEFTILTPPLPGSLTLDIHRLEASGVVLTSSDPHHDELRRLEDFELAHLVEVADSTIPAR